MCFRIPDKRYVIWLLAIMILTVVNRKGGTGKTTTAAYIGQHFHSKGAKLLAIDLDGDLSWYKWYKTGALPYEVHDLSREPDIRPIIERHEGVVVIDTPPNDEAIIYKTASVADEVLVPLSATNLDLSRLFSTLKTVEDVERMRNTPLASVLLTRWQGQHNLSQAVVDALNKEEVPVLETKIRLLTRYAGPGMPEYLEEYAAALEEMGVSHG